MLLSKLDMSVGRRAHRDGSRNIRVANDNPSREQILFEKCVQRELGGKCQDGGKRIDGDQGKADPRS
ncbi:hypothetical protein [uncultured Parasphingorhabdus sp.]|uniref:hypothetical protein n=1 Tax=uncultured Parasphingorhabdus sp. TaxID=2709694 RepID=UPI0030DD246B